MVTVNNMFLTAEVNAAIEEIEKIETVDEHVNSNYK